MTTHRYWVDFVNKVEREWNNFEYIYHNPNTRIVEKHWYNYCPVCGAYQHRANSKQDAIHNIHKCFGCSTKDSKMSGYDFKDFEFRCMEVKTNHIDNFGNVGCIKFYD